MLHKEGGSKPIDFSIKMPKIKTTREWKNFSRRAELKVSQDIRRAMDSPHLYTVSTTRRRVVVKYCRDFGTFVEKSVNCHFSHRISRRSMSDP